MAYVLSKRLRFLVLLLFALWYVSPSEARDGEEAIVPIRWSVPIAVSPQVSLGGGPLLTRVGSGSTGYFAAVGEDCVFHLIDPLQGQFSSFENTICAHAGFSSWNPEVLRTSPTSSAVCWGSTYSHGCVERGTTASGGPTDAVIHWDHPFAPNHPLHVVVTSGVLGPVLWIVSLPYSFGTGVITVLHTANGSQVRQTVFPGSLGFTAVACTAESFYCAFASDLALVGVQLLGNVGPPSWQQTTSDRQYSNNPALWTIPRPPGFFSRTADGKKDVSQEVFVEFGDWRATLHDAINGSVLATILVANRTDLPKGTPHRHVQCDGWLFAFPDHFTDGSGAPVYETMVYVVDFFAVAPRGTNTTAGRSYRRQIGLPSSFKWDTDTAASALRCTYSPTEGRATFTVIGSQSALSVERGSMAVSFSSLPPSSAVCGQALWSPVIACTNSTLRQVWGSALNVSSTGTTSTGGSPSLAATEELHPEWAMDLFWGTPQTLRAQPLQQVHEGEDTISNVLTVRSSRALAVVMLHEGAMTVEGSVVDPLPRNPLWTGGPPPTGEFLFRTGPAQSFCVAERNGTGVTRTLLRCGVVTANGGSLDFRWGWNISNVSEAETTAPFWTNRSRTIPDPEPGLPANDSAFLDLMLFRAPLRGALIVFARTRNCFVWTVINQRQEMGLWCGPGTELNSEPGWSITHVAVALSPGDSALSASITFRRHSAVAFDTVSLELFDAPFVHPFTTNRFATVRAVTYIASVRLPTAPVDVGISALYLSDGRVVVVAVVQGGVKWVTALVEKREDSSEATVQRAVTDPFDPSVALIEYTVTNSLQNTTATFVSRMRLADGDVVQLLEVPCASSVVSLEPALFLPQRPHSLLTIGRTLRTPENLTAFVSPMGSIPSAMSAEGGRNRGDRQNESTETLWTMSISALTNNSTRRNLQQALATTTTAVHSSTFDDGTNVSLVGYAAGFALLRIVVDHSQEEEEEVESSGWYGLISTCSGAVVWQTTGSPFVLGWPTGIPGSPLVLWSRGQRATDTSYVDVRDFWSGQLVYRGAMATQPVSVAQSNGCTAPSGGASVPYPDTACTLYLTTMPSGGTNATGVVTAVRNIPRFEAVAPTAVSGFANQTCSFGRLHSGTTTAVGAPPNPSSDDPSHHPPTGSPAVPSSSPTLQQGGRNAHRSDVVPLAVSLSVLYVICTAFGVLLWWRRRHLKGNADRQAPLTASNLARVPLISDGDRTSMYRAVGALEDGPYDYGNEDVSDIVLSGDDDGDDSDTTSSNEDDGNDAVVRVCRYTTVQQQHQQQHRSPPFDRQF